MAIRWDLHHSLILLGSTIGGALAGYFESMPATSLVAALGSWQTAKPLLIGAAFAAVGALVALAKQSFLVPPAPPAAASPGPDEVRRGVPTGPVIMKRTAALFVAASVAACTCLTGCAALSAWWQQVEQNPAAAISQFVQYVEGFIGTAQAIWSLLLPSLGPNAAQANTDFNNALATLQNSLTALQDGVQAAQLAQQSNPDFSALEGAVQDAVAKVFAIIQQWQGTAQSGLAVSEAQATLSHQATTIAHWTKRTTDGGAK